MLGLKFKTVIEEVLCESVVEFNWVKETMFSSVVSVSLSSGEKRVVKFPGQNIFSSLNPEKIKVEAEFLNRSVGSFRDELAKFGVPLQSIYEIKISKIGLPVHITLDQGDDCAQVLNKNPGLADEIIKKIIQSLEGILLFGNNKIGLDARLNNFALKADNNPVLIDTFPPLFFYEGKNLVHFPNPIKKKDIENEINRKYGSFSILRRLWFEILAINPEWDNFFLKALDDLPSSIKTDLKNKFNLLHNLFYDTKDHYKLLMSLPPSEVDMRREITFRLIPMSQNRPELTEQIIRLTNYVSLDEIERRRRNDEFIKFINKYCV